MLFIVKGFDRRYARELDLAFRFRHQVFVEEAGWHDLQKPDHREIDQFDTDETLHVIVIKQEKVVAYSRLSATTRPHLLSDVYPHLATRGVPRDVGTWEWSRMGTARSARSDGRGWGGPIGLLFRCVSYAAILNGIETLVWQAHPVWITRAFELGFTPEPLGLPQRLAGDRVVAAQMDVHADVFGTMDAVGVPRVALWDRSPMSDYVAEHPRLP